MKPFNPKSTVFTNLMLDIIMPATTPNAWKILCFAMRKTAGWADNSTYSGRKESDVISLSQFMKGCGIKSENTAMEAINYCLDKGYLLRFAEGQSYRYSLNVEYELTSSDVDIVDYLTSSEIEEVVTKTSSIIEDTNSKLINNKYIKRHKNNSTSAKKNGDQMRTKEEINAATEAALLKSYTNPTIGYAQLPADIVEISAKVCELWYFKAPTNRKKMSFWIQSCRDLQDACAEFKLHLLDLLHNDWMSYINSHPCAPHTASGPQSLVKDAEAKAALLRSGNNSPMWGSKQKTTSKLDV